MPATYALLLVFRAPIHALRGSPALPVAQECDVCLPVQRPDSFADTPALNTFSCSPLHVASAASPETTGSRRWCRLPASERKRAGVGVSVIILVYGYSYEI